MAVGGEVCGALGCRTTEGLILVDRGDEQRVLCARHALEWGWPW